MRLVLRFPITMIFLISLVVFRSYVRPGPDDPIPSHLEWIIVPAYVLTLMVSMTGLRSPFSFIGALLFCVGLDYVLWTVLPRQVRRWRRDTS